MVFRCKVFRCVSSVVALAILRCAAGSNETAREQRLRGRQVDSDRGTAPQVVVAAGAAREHHLREEGGNVTSARQRSAEAAAEGQPVASERGPKTAKPASSPALAKSSGAGSGNVSAMASWGSWGCDGYCSGEPLCEGRSRDSCENTIFDCWWECSWGYRGICTGGFLCDFTDPSACETSVFDCTWEWR